MKPLLVHYKYKHVLSITAVNALINAHARKTNFSRCALFKYHQNPIRNKLNFIEVGNSSTRDVFIDL